MMEIRHAVHPDHAAGFGTEELRKHFLIEGLFVPGKPRLVYSHMDRLIVGGVLPVGPTTLDVDEAVIGAPTLLSRREMGIINVGGPGAVTVGGKTYPMAPHDGLFVGMGAGDLSFASDNAGEPAKFYLNSAPAHTSFPTTKVAFDEATPLALGEDKSCNRRTIRKYFHPDGVKSCQLVVITSYSIHYTKLYEIWPACRSMVRRRCMPATERKSATSLPEMGARGTTLRSWRA